jgi:hypothetical protein
MSSTFNGLPTGRQSLVNPPTTNGVGMEGAGVRWYGLSVADYV